MRSSKWLALPLFALLLVAGAAFGKTSEDESKPSDIPDKEELRTMIGRFEPVDLGVDLSKMPVNEKMALSKILHAARVMDVLFLRQVWSGNEALERKLRRDRSELGVLRFRSFTIDKGPWSRLDGFRPTIPDVPQKPKGANFYPEDSTREEIENWLSGLSQEEALYARGFFTTIRRDPCGKLMAVGYDREYRRELIRAARYLREAAFLTREPTLKEFLLKRADSFFSNNYYDSDVAWMKLDSKIEPTIGPYEVYEDEWFNAKAAFEAFVTIRDDAETAKLSKFSSELQELEDNLPIDSKYKNPKIGAMAPIRVVNSIFSSGDGNRGVQTAAFNLPNDEKITLEMGAKRVMLKNIQEAKFKKVLVPIADRVLSEQDKSRVSFDAFFTHILMHELMHGIGPSTVTENGKTETVRARLQNTFSAIEESKADVTGLWAMQRLIDKGVIDRQLQSTLYMTYLASTFRSLRFGINEAHGKGVAIQLNYLLDRGAYKVSDDGKFSVDETKIAEGIRDLTASLLTIEARGDKPAAEDLIKKHVYLRPEVKAALDGLTGVPVDIVPSFSTAEKLMKRYP
ncbi:MAG: hypothetical protein HQK54_16975 [Oligoflexales bacterium]|nr:hypothetical protein [Oligoflexales bacterium]